MKSTFYNFIQNINAQSHLRIFCKDKLVEEGKAYTFFDYEKGKNNLDYGNYTIVDIGFPHSNYVNIIIEKSY